MNESSGDRGASSIDVMPHPHSATHQVTAWLTKDEGVWGTAQHYAQECAEGTLLSAFVEWILYHSEHYPVPAEARRLRTQVRDSLTREAFDSIDWPKVASSLLSE